MRPSDRHAPLRRTSPGGNRSFMSLRYRSHRRLSMSFMWPMMKGSSGFSTYLQPMSSCSVSPISGVLSNTSVDSNCRLVLVCCRTLIFPLIHLQLIIGRNLISGNLQKNQIRQWFIYSWIMFANGQAIQCYLCFIFLDGSHMISSILDSDAQFSRIALSIDHPHFSSLCR